MKTSQIHLRVDKKLKEEIIELLGGERGALSMFLRTTIKHFVKTEKIRRANLALEENTDEKS